MLCKVKKVNTCHENYLTDLVLLRHPLEGELSHGQLVLDVQPGVAEDSADVLEREREEERLEV